MTENGSCLLVADLRTSIPVGPTSRKSTTRTTTDTDLQNCWPSLFILTVSRSKRNHIQKIQYLDLFKWTYLSVHKPVSKMCWFRNIVYHANYCVDRFQTHFIDPQHRSAVAYPVDRTDVNSSPNLHSGKSRCVDQVSQSCLRLVMQIDCRWWLNESHKTVETKMEILHFDSLRVCWLYAIKCLICASIRWITQKLLF